MANVPYSMQMDRNLINSNNICACVSMQACMYEKWLANEKHFVIWAQPLWSDWVQRKANNSGQIWIMPNKNTSVGIFHQRRKKKKTKTKLRTWQAFVRRSHNLMVWSSEPDIKLSLIGDIQRETILQKKKKKKERAYMKEELTQLSIVNFFNLYNSDPKFL